MFNIYKFIITEYLFKIKHECRKPRTLRPPYGRPGRLPHRQQDPSDVKYPGGFPLPEGEQPRVLPRCRQAGGVGQTGGGGGFQHESFPWLVDCFNKLFSVSFWSYLYVSSLD